MNQLIWSFVYSSNPALNLGKWLSKCTKILKVYEGLKLPTIQNCFPMKDDAVQTFLKVMNPLPTCMARF
jgi:hypothetical protein